MTRDATERAAYLSGVCGDDATLRDEVADLLAVAASLPEDFLRPLRQVSLDAPDAGRAVAAPTAGSAAGPPIGPAEGVQRRPDWPPLDSTGADGLDGGDDTATALVGSHVGAFEVLRVIAGGGMGVVYEARQQQPRRPVALKIMKPGYATPAMLRRFQLEAELLGRLRHPNIAQVYQAGLADTPLGKLPYFALEYVAGARTITQYAYEESLNLRQRLALFATVCDAVQHGHRNGVIHRDVKPANILVDEHGQPKLIDFGVARLTERNTGLTTAHTLAGQIVGTVQYMSPEQCDGDPAAVDTRSDVYSLGVILYELLTGTLPYRASSASLLSATRTIREHEPARPSTINRKLRGAIETVVLKALEKDRERRYSSADALARDIRHVLSREPIEARRPTLLTGLVRWAVRHPVMVTLGVCAVLIVLTGGAVGLTWWYAMMRPDHVEALEPERRKAVLRTAAGRVLETWGGTEPGAVEFARDMWLTIGGTERHVAIIGFKNAEGLECPPGVYVFDCNRNRKKPLLIGRLEPNDVPYVLKLRDAVAYSRDNFCAVSLAVADVFDPPAGPELIVAHQHDVYTQTALRIYALDGGEVLWQVWTDSQVNSFRWLQATGVLLVAGLEGRVHWAQRGVECAPEPNLHPWAVMALRPQRGYRVAHYVALEHPEENLRLLWVRCLLAADNAQLLRFPWHAALLSWSAETRDTICGVNMVAIEGMAGVNWPFDGEGVRSDIAPRYTGNYADRTTRPRDDPLWLPSPTDIDPNTGKPEIYWGDLPEIQWFNQDPNQCDPTTRDLKLHFGVDVTEGKERR